MYERSCRQDSSLTSLNTALATGHWYSIRKDQSLPSMSAKHMCFSGFLGRSTPLIEVVRDVDLLPRSNDMGRPGRASSLRVLPQYLNRYQPADLYLGHPASCPHHAQQEFVDAVRIVPVLSVKTSCVLACKFLEEMAHSKWLTRFDALFSRCASREWRVGPLGNFL